MFISTDLPEHLIARYPKAQRTASRLMALDDNTGDISHQTFPDVLSHLAPGDLLVFNNTFRL